MDDKLNKELILSTLLRTRNELNTKFGVLTIGLIGSYSRNEQSKDSDIDFLVEFNHVNYNNLAGLNIYLEKIFGKKVDIIIKSRYLRKEIVESVSKEAVYA